MTCTPKVYATFGVQVIESFEFFYLFSSVQQKTPPSDIADEGVFRESPRKDTPTLPKSNIYSVYDVLSIKIYC